MDGKERGMHADIPCAESAVVNVEAGMKAIPTFCAMCGPSAGCGPALWNSGNTFRGSRQENRPKAGNGD